MKTAILSLGLVVLSSSLLTACDDELKVEVIKRTLEQGVDNYDQTFDRGNYLRASALRTSGGADLNKVGQTFDFDAPNLIALRPNECNNLVKQSRVSTRKLSAIQNYDYHFVKYSQRETSGQLDLSAASIPINLNIAPQNTQDKLVSIYAALSDIQGLDAQATYLDEMATCCRIFEGCGKNVLTDAVLMNASVRALELRTSAMDARVKEAFNTGGVIGAAKLIHTQKQGQDLGSNTEMITHFAFTKLPSPAGQKRLDPRDVGLVMSPSSLRCNPDAAPKEEKISVTFQHPEVKHLGYRITSAALGQEVKCLENCSKTVTLSLVRPSCAAIKNNPQQAQVSITADAFFTYAARSAPAYSIVNTLTVLPADVPLPGIPKGLEVALKPVRDVLTGSADLNVATGSSEDVLVVASVKSDSRDVSLNAFPLPTGTGTRLMFTVRASFVQDKSSPALIPLRVFVIYPRPGSSERVIVEQEVNVLLSFPEGETTL